MRGSLELGWVSAWLLAMLASCSGSEDFPIRIGSLVVAACVLALTLARELRERRQRRDDEAKRERDRVDREIDKL